MRSSSFATIIILAALICAMVIYSDRDFGYYTGNFSNAWKSGNSYILISSPTPLMEGIIYDVENKEIKDKRTYQIIYTSHKGEGVSFKTYSKKLTTDERFELSSEDPNIAKIFGKNWTKVTDDEEIKTFRKMISDDNNYQALQGAM